MADHQQSYVDIRRRIAELVGELDDEVLDGPVAATPEWSVRDVVAHLTGIPVYVAAGQIAEASSAEGAQAAVESRRATPIAEVLAEWDEAAPALEDGFEAFPFDVAAGPVIGDAYIHELDLRYALGAPVTPDAEEVAATFTYYLLHLGQRIDEKGLPALRVVAGDLEGTAGAGEPVATVRGDEIAVVRALAGRRTREQIRDLAWEGDPTAYVDVFSDYGYPDAAIE